MSTATESHVESRNLKQILLSGANDSDEIKLKERIRACLGRKRCIGGLKGLGRVAVEPFLLTSRNDYIIKS